MRRYDRPLCVCVRVRVCVCVCVRVCSLCLYAISTSLVDHLQQLHRTMSLNSLSHLDGQVEEVSQYVSVKLGGREDVLP